MQEKIELLEDIQASITQLAEGKGLTHYVAKGMVLDGLESVGWVTCYPPMVRVFH